MILIGSDTTGTTNVPLDYMHFGQFTATKTGTSSIFVIHSTVTGNARVAIYNDDTDSLGTLNTGNDTSQSIVSGRNELVLPGASIVDSTTYWLAAICDTTGGLRYTSSGVDYCYKAQSYSGWSTWPSSVTGETYNTSTMRFSIYESVGDGLFSLGVGM